MLLKIYWLNPVKIPTFIVVLAFAFAPFACAEPSRPNVVVIVADDLGYSDLGCYGGELSTPALDTLASEGVRLSRFYNGGMCVISRASMLTGQWWPRAVPKFSQSDLLPERLHAVGYQTGLIGKWHLDGHPMDHGFDHFFGFLNGFADHFAGASTYRLDREPFRDFVDDFYSSDALSDRAIDFIDRSSQGDDPYFLYLSYQAPHNPLQAPRDDILRHRGRYLAGWESIRQSRFERQKSLGLVPTDSVLPSYPLNLPLWESLSPQQADLEDLRMSVYAAMVERMDRGIGRVIDAIDATKRADDTLILFLSDNGTDSFSVVDGPMLAQGKLPGDRSSNWQPGTGWAYASVTPWRMYKISQHGGGVTSGAIARWRSQLKNPGRIESHPVHIVDIMPTILEAAEASNHASLAGKSFQPLIDGEYPTPRPPMFFQYMDNRAVRTDAWTLAEVDGEGWELFASDDVLERNDIADQHPRVVDELQSTWLAWWKAESGEAEYVPTSTKSGPHYAPQGDRGSGRKYVPSAMPAELSNRYPVSIADRLHDDR